jgi:hypothetical protein
MNHYPKKKQRGQSLMEFALMIPVLMLVAMGIFDLGRVIYYYSTITNAAREGARYGAVNHCDEAGIQARAHDMAVGLGEAVQFGEITRRFDEHGAPEFIEITVTYSFAPVTPLIGNFLGSDGTILLQSRSTKWIEQPLVCD